MKKKSVAAIMAILLGTFGVHKFYLGDKGIGIIYLLLCWTGIPTLLGIIDGVLLLLKSDESFNDKYNNQKLSAFKSIQDGAKFFLEGVNGKLYVYDNKVEIEHGGVLGTITHGLSGKKTLPMKSIQSVQFREGGSAVNGFIQFGVLGGNERQGGILGATDDENSIVFTKKKNADAYEIKDYIESKIYASNEPSTTVVNQVSSADEILKLKSLFDSGVITEEEFEKKKTQLLK